MNDRHSAPIWAPSPERVIRSNMTAFFRFASRRGAPFNGTPGRAAYEEFHRWSVDNREKFWPLVWDFCGIVGESGVNGTPTSVLRGDRMAPPDGARGPKWFPNARLNFAENLLHRGEDRDAIISWNENGFVRRLTFAELLKEVVALALALEGAGVCAGDRVAGFLPNIAEAVIAMLAAASIGAVWSSCSPDFGVQGVLDRFGQIEPKILFCSESYVYAGKQVDLRARIREIAERLPSVTDVVVTDYPASGPPEMPFGKRWSAFIGENLMKRARGGRASGAAESSGSGRFENGNALFAHFPFDHPLYVMYSSGTTGLPKCMVHGAGGTLIQLLKEHILHTDITAADRVFYFTTCGWMMWNWLVNSLAAGAAIVLYDGAPLSPSPGILWQMAETERVTVFGTSAKYLALLEKSGAEPRTTRDLAALRTILSTGSPLAPHSYDYVHSKIKKEVHLASISGGTDIISCFALGNPIAPVYRGEIQCRGLGMAVDVFDGGGKPVRGVPGELVCTKAFPSMPVSFWNDADGAKYRAAYFEYFPGVWRHGDWAELTEHDGIVIYGRSDATLNPGGIRIGTAEIYRQVEQLPEILEAVAVGQEIDGGSPGDVRVVLFVRLRDGVELDDALAKKIAERIRENLSPAHVPKRIIAVADIPRTVSGKISEIAVRETIHGREVTNTEALANPESLKLYRDLPELRQR